MFIQNILEIFVIYSTFTTLLTCSVHNHYIPHPPLPTADVVHTQPFTRSRTKSSDLSTLHKKHDTYFSPNTPKTLAQILHNFDFTHFVEWPILEQKKQKRKPKTRSRIVQPAIPETVQNEYTKHTNMMIHKSPSRESKVSSLKLDGSLSSTRPNPTVLVPHPPDHQYQASITDVESQTSFAKKTSRNNESQTTVFTDTSHDESLPQQKSMLRVSKIEAIQNNTGNVLNESLPFTQYNAGSTFLTDIDVPETQFFGKLMRKRQSIEKWSFFEKTAQVEPQPRKRRKSIVLEPTKDKYGEPCADFRMNDEVNTNKKSSDKDQQSQRLIKKCDKILAMCGKHFSRYRSVDTSLIT